MTLIIRQHKKLLIVLRVYIVCTSTFYKLETSIVSTLTLNSFSSILTVGSSNWFAASSALFQYFKKKNLYFMVYMANQVVDLTKPLIPQIECSQTYGEHMHQ
ncbi:hypothetical protein SAY86_004579 [Trapa natans]|uniref:Uncharacterized protein n=1 Tax=Trapa natans TaxID=22666 RepID=A0AAN7MFY3_TRANT|nr:hypothetical protein SAY86_004579 [Trapa natans]